MNIDNFRERVLSVNKGAWIASAQQNHINVELINGLFTALEESEAINNAGFKSPKECRENCLNYIGAREDTVHFEAELKKAEATIAQVRADERERCASEADCYPYRTPLEIADEIRKLK